MHYVMVFQTIHSFLVSCQNSRLANSPNIEIDIKSLVLRYVSNYYTDSVVRGGLEPMDSWDDLYAFIKALRIVTDDDVFNASFDNYKIEGMTAVLAGGKIFSGLSHIAADRGYLLNTKTFNLKMYSGYNIQPLAKRTSFNQLVDAAILLVS